MSLFQNEKTSDDQINYRSMGKDQLIMLINSQKSDIDVLTRQLAQTAPSKEDDDRLAALTKENEALKAKAQELEQQLSTAVSAAVPAAPSPEDAERTAALIAENEALKAKNEELEQQLSAAVPSFTQAGSIAEMSFRVSGVMYAAQQAADDYLAKIKEMHDSMSRNYAAYEQDARRQADEIIRSANAEAQEIRQKAQDEANEIWSALQMRFNSYIDEKKQNTGSAPTEQHPGTP